MPKSYVVPEIVQLGRDDWVRLRNIRLWALKDSPDSFLSTYDKELSYSEDHWRAEFDRGDWHVGTGNGEDIGLLGVTREPHTPADECYLEYLWVAPGSRRSGLAFRMVTTILDVLRDSGIRISYLWVLTAD